jgi:hypothetical protein
MEWEQVIIIIGVVAGLFLSLRTDIKRLEDKMAEGFEALEERLRKVETEQARVAGLLEGLGFAGNLPSADS